MHQRTITNDRVSFFSVFFKTELRAWYSWCSRVTLPECRGWMFVYANDLLVKRVSKRRRAVDASTRNFNVPTRRFQCCRKEYTNFAFSRRSFRPRPQDSIDLENFVLSFFSSSNTVGFLPGLGFSDEETRSRLQSQAKRKAEKKLTAARATVF